MNYQTFDPHPDLASIVKFYWTLEVTFDPNNEKQKIIPDGCIEMTFNFGDGIKKFVSESEFVIHPPAMVMGQRTQSFFIEPTGNVDSFAVCFYPYGFTHFVNASLKDLVDKEVTLDSLFNPEESARLEQKMKLASNTQERIKIIESFLLGILNKESTKEHLVASTVQALIETNGKVAINSLANNSSANRRQLERNFRKQIGISPKLLGKVIRMNSALNLLLNKQDETLTQIAYESNYFDQAHFIRDFKALVGITPKEFIGNDNLKLAKLFYG